MDFGAVVSLDHGFGDFSASSEAGFASHISSASDPETQNKRKTLYGSGFCNNKQERSECTAFDDYWQASKLARSSSDISDFLAPKAMLQQRNSNFPTRSNSSLSFFDNNGHTQHQMLSFSSPLPKPESFLGDKISQNATLACFPNALSAYNSRNIAGFNSVSFVNGRNMHGEKGLFTQSQWMELEQQALIYKYITANVPIPSNLLIPIRKDYDSVGFSSFPPGLLRPNTLGWGAFHLGFSNNTDPEPGRCRRTDGKKWRCSREAVADQKYCERHMNRGRHRSRKPVEGQTGHSLAAAAAAATSSSVALPVLGGTVSNSLSAAFNSYSADTTHMNRMQSNRGGLSLLSKSSLFSNPKDQISYDESSGLESERTQLSISLSTMSTSDNNLSENTASAGPHHHLPQHHDRQALNLIPMSWEPSLSGPLGEVLHHTANNSNNNVDSESGNDKRPLSSASVLNLMTEGWDSSPPTGSSPTGVLQKTAFGSFSNGSTGSGTRADDNKDLLASAARLNTSNSSW